MDQSAAIDMDKRSGDVEREETRYRPFLYTPHCVYVLGNSLERSFLPIYPVWHQTALPEAACVPRLGRLT